MRLLVVNAGSSSLKVTVLGDDDTTLFDEDLQASGDGERAVLENVLDRIPAVDAAAHRVVHGGSRFVGAVRLDAEVDEELAALRELAPLHNPRSIELIESLRRLRPSWPQYACFDTTFHANLPEAARTYAVPRAWSEAFGLRRYGFHGLSHAWATSRSAELLQRPVTELRIVSAHIGSGASLAAVAGGRSVETTMGFTPLEGLVMATRPGNLDAGVVLYLARHSGMSLEELEDGLERRSGLFGMAGAADLREVIARSDDGDDVASSAYAVYLLRIVELVGAMVASMDGVDAIVFTGGAGFGSARLRRDVCSSLTHLGVELRPDDSTEPNEDRVQSSPTSRVAVLVVRAREDLEIARQVRELVTAAAETLSS